MPNQALKTGSNQLVPVKQPVSVTELALVPVVIENAGRKAKKKFVEFFTAEIENDNTRAAYAEAVDRFLYWCHTKKLSIETIEPTLVATYFKQDCPETRSYKERSKPLLKAKSTKKQHLAAVKQMFDHLVRNGVLEINPAASVRGPKLVIKKGKTPVLEAEDARRLIKAIDVSKIAGLRDRAMIGIMVYQFARVSAVVSMNVEDYYQNGKRWYVRYQEKNGKEYDGPAHHKTEEYLDAYIDAAGIRDQKKMPLFRTLDRKRQLTETRSDRGDVLRMNKRRARQAGVAGDICSHTWRGTGLTNYFTNGGSLENGQFMALHSSPRTTKLYDRTEEVVTLEEVERVRI